MKIREFLALFEGRNPESELAFEVLPPFNKSLAVVGVANRGEYADSVETDASTALEENGPCTLPTGCTPKEDERPLPAGCHWDDTFVFLEEGGTTI